jgi:hypothetical protein
MNFKNPIKIGLFALFAGSLFNSCFPEDEKQPLHPIGGIVGSTSNSIYAHQSFISLSEMKELSFNLNSDWDIGFEASTTGEHAILNNSDFLRIANLGPIGFEQATSIPESAKWVYDASSGNFDSLAISNWVNTKVIPYEYTQNVYILGRLDDYGIMPLKKFQLIELTDNHYKVVIATINNLDTDTLIVNKNQSLNYVKATIRQNAAIVTIEPNKDEWEIQFTQYEDSIPDDNGVLYPYVLRGAFINPFKIKVAQYYISTSEVPESLSEPEIEQANLQAYFENDSIIKPMPDSLYSTDWDAIGWEWKKVTIDEAANTAYYKADMRRIYLIKDIINNKEYKLQFFSYYSNGVPGYPWFEYIGM